MKWIQITIITSHEASEAVANQLFEMQSLGVEITEDNKNDTLLTAYFPLDDKINSKVNTLRTFLSKLPAWGIQPNPAKIELKRIESEKWTEAWKANFTPQKVGEKIHIVPTWYEQPINESDIVIRLDPGMAFGTGYHPTTRLSLQMLEKAIRPNQIVADVGTGSGILAIAAIKLGAKHIDAIELDPTAIPVAMTNFANNSVSKKITLHEADGLRTVKRKYDLIVANILTKAIIPLIPYCRDRLNADGSLILSGILESEQADVQETLKENGLECVSVTQQAEDKLMWVAMLARFLC